MHIESVRYTDGDARDDSSADAVVGLTTPSCLTKRAEECSNVVWMRHKELGIWREYTWKEGYERVKCLSLGLMALGFERGNRLAIIGDNHPNWFWAELAAQCAGGAVLALSPTCSPSELANALRESACAFVIAADQEQVDKLLEIKDLLTSVKRVIYWDSRGLGKYHDAMLILSSFDEVLALGQQYAASHPELFGECMGRVDVKDAALIVYCAGEESIFTHNSMFAVCGAYLSQPSSVNETHEWVCSNPPGSTEEQLIGLTGSLDRGMKMNFPEGTDTVEEDTREIGPTVVCYPPHIWERFARTTQERMAHADRLTKSLYRLCLVAGSRLAGRRLRGERLPVFWRTVDGVCRLVMFNPLRDKLGLRNIRIACCSGDDLPREVLSFMSAIGIDISRGFGSRKANVLPRQSP